MAHPSWPFLLVALLLSLTLVMDEVSSVEAVNVVKASYHPMGTEGSVQAKDCPNACSYRCSETSHKKPCMFFCIMCCTKCLCVPSGTYGHKEECPCYNNWKTKEGGPKCP